ncbi:hypothetical protein [Phenylobacterium sp.]|jgi:hypothetical protein|uniref:hypothetical protein n=1 Tax=Phenylobacterium sp. TaxID=1871053 RepID=UPI002F409F79
MSDETADQATVSGFFGGYARAFERFDLDALAKRLAYPCQIMSDAGRVATFSMASAGDYRKRVAPLIDLYRRVGVARGEIADLDVRGVTERTAIARVRWRVHSATAPLYEFDAAYTLVATLAGWKIAAIIHDELPKLQGCLGA